MPAPRSSGMNAAFRRRPSAARLAEWKEWLDEAADRFERPDFLEADPLGIPHRYPDAEDAAVAGVFAATLAWGNRKSILRSCHDLLDRMDDAPADPRPVPVTESRQASGFCPPDLQRRRRTAVCLVPAVPRSRWGIGGGV